MFSKKNINDIPIESTPHGNGSRKLVVGKTDTSSSYFEAMTYGYLPAHETWVVHKHDNIIEICLVIKGTGIIRDLSGKTEQFQPGDRFIFPANEDHELENTSEITAEFYFIRFQDK